MEPGQSGEEGNEIPRRCAWLLRQLRAGRGRILRTSGSRIPSRPYRWERGSGPWLPTSVPKSRGCSKRNMSANSLHAALSQRRCAGEMLDAAYWKKGCSSLGKLRYCVLLGIGTSNRAMFDGPKGSGASRPRRWMIPRTCLKTRRNGLWRARVICHPI